jgi:hypothetical protein
MQPDGRRGQTLDDTQAVLRQVLLELDDLGPMRRTAPSTERPAARHSDALALTPLPAPQDF